MVIHGLHPEDPDLPTVVLGLAAENMARMTRGEPIKVNLRTLNPSGPPTALPDVDVIVAATDTDDWEKFMARATALRRQ